MSALLAAEIAYERAMKATDLAQALGDEAAIKRARNAEDAMHARLLTIARQAKEIEDRASRKRAG